jgi:peptidoglycan/xylan/chitin deacetylase (PgdA/CDA1 family)
MEGKSNDPLKEIGIYNKFGAGGDSARLNISIMVTFYLDDLLITKTIPAVTPLRTRAEIQQDIDDHWEGLGYAAKPTKFMALGYDDGPSDRSRELLSVLANKNVHATFFITGNRITTEDRKAILREMRDAGYELANHSYTHDNPSPLYLMSIQAAENEIQMCTDAIYNATNADGKPVLPNFIRAPNVRYSANLLAACTNKGLPLIHGTTASDWGSAASNPSGNAASVTGQVNAILNGASPWQITLNHDPASGIPANILAAAPQIIDGLRSAGFWLLTVSEMRVMYTGTALQAGKIYDNFNSPRTH